MSSSYQRYNEVLRDESGNAVADATVYVYVGDSMDHAALYDGAGDPVTNPVSTDSAGRIINDTESADANDAIGFRAKGGRYRIEGTANGESVGPIPDILIGNVQQYDQGTGDTEVPTNADVADTIATVPTATDGGTDEYTVTLGRTYSAGEKASINIDSANTTTTPTLNGDVCTTKDGSALWPDALSGVHRFQLGSSSWKVLDPNPSQQRDLARAATDTARGDVKVLDEDDFASDSADHVPTQQSVKAYTDEGDPTPQTAVDATNSGANDLTEIDFTGIKAGANRIIISLDGLSLSGSDQLLIQIGDSGGVETSGYTSISIALNDSGGAAGSTSAAGFIVRSNSTSTAFRGAITLVRLSGNTWVASYILGKTTTEISTGGGDKSLSGELDRVRLTVTGTNTFDGGNINLLVE